ncbi:sugar phosphate isomerase/epimerase family protein [Natronomonas gomsonensis]|uniref:sugar phosphate isomerase/epimerase family protein n=1 Tax=Natronomonas gomsonensis TaxID=1046043 RepID=UPI00227A6E27|nr:sugar phosphate isomerase/epimerase family protein [Natronomonas gomsonensis]
MRLGASMDVRFGATVEEFVGYLVDLGLDHVELTTEYLQGHPDAPDPETVGEIATAYGVSVTYHAPFRDWNLGSFNDDSAQAGVAQVKRTLDAAATAGAGAVVVHGGSVPRRYPDWVREEGRRNTIESLRTCAEHAAEVGVPLCLENQPFDDRNERHTVGPDALAETLDAVGIGPDVLGITLDVGHASVNGNDWREYVDRFGDHITVCHLHDNDGESDAHDPLTDYEPIVDAVGARYNVFETKAVGDVATCLGRETDCTPPAQP